jgi:hypothetical protein
MAPAQQDVIVIPDEDDEFMSGEDGEVMYVDDDDHADDNINVKSEVDIRERCRDEVFAVFPDICPDYLEDVAISHAYHSESVIIDLTDRSEKEPLPKRVSLKRKRDSEDVAERPCDLTKKYESAEWREQHKYPQYVSYA